MVLPIRKAILIRPKKATLAYLASHMLESGQNMNDLIEFMVAHCRASRRFKVPKRMGDFDKKLAARERKLQRLKAMAEK